MRAAVLHAPGKPPRFEEFPDPTPGEGEVLITVGGRKALCQPARISCRLRRGWRGTARGWDADVFWWATATVRRDGRAHCGAASAMFFGP